MKTVRNIVKFPTFLEFYRIIKLLISNGNFVGKRFLGIVTNEVIITTITIFTVE